MERLTANASGASGNAHRTDGGRGYQKGEKMNCKDKAFCIGCAVVLGYIAREIGGSDVAMKELGIKIKDLEDAGVESFDLDPIKHEAGLTGGQP